MTDEPREPVCYCGHTEAMHCGRQTLWGETFHGCCAAKGDGKTTLDCLCGDFHPAEPSPVTPSEERT